ncbi:hypothetical protein AYL99_02581 [Fonsecaea erecta]|uniref:Uncharacterized protein n=1 Tax=Fonsecaea erecta TaxID=1367422 RepID=A0A178ZUA6_9EURO|nr:hypothetical protein AYL99_02581 [Fonsecaea erecta]OAP63354.1 hypothetical protein AYL99_02581 [Fonsecaea erecta]
MIHGDIHDPSNRNALRPCSACRKRTSNRYVCLDHLCDYTLCRSCWFSRGVNVHPHKTFKVVEARWSVRSNNSVSAGYSCCDTAALNHCSSCAMPLALGQPVSFCKTCFVDTTEPVFRCLSCSSPGAGDDHHHPSHHESWRWTFQVAKQGISANGIYCQTCAQPIHSMDALKGHPHTDYVDIYTEDNLNHVIARSYRECQRKTMRIDGFVAVASDEQCSLCLHRTTSTAPLNCQQCDKLLKLCLHCLQNASKLHVHPIPRFHERANPAPGELQGSPLPAQDPFCHSTLRLQRPASQSYDAAAPARPTAGGYTTIPPPGQRISSAPAQGLWSRPQSYVPQRMRPYSAAQHQHQYHHQQQQQQQQEEAFLNTLATDIAVTSMTNAAIAAAGMNAIYDDGGGGFNGQGTADTTTTTTTGVDMSGMDATQDTWPDNETWQDTAVVYDSGWALDDSEGFDPTC